MAKIKFEIKRILVTALLSITLFSNFAQSAQALTTQSPEKPRKVYVNKETGVKAYINENSEVVVEGIKTEPIKMENATIKDYVYDYVNSYKVYKEMKGIDLDKEFNIEFTKKVDKESLHLDAEGRVTQLTPIKIINSDGELQPITVDVKGDNISVAKLNGGYMESSEYALIIEDDLASLEGTKSLGDNFVVIFNTVKDGKHIAVKDEYSLTVPAHYQNIFDEYTEAFPIAFDADEKLPWDWDGRRMEVYGDKLLEYVDYFNAKYKANQLNLSKYGDTVDPKIYMKYPGSTLKWDKVNKDTCLTERRAGSAWLGGVGNSIEDDDKLYIYNEGNRHTSTTTKTADFVWKLDVEKDLIDLINNEREARGLNKLKIDPNLMAISKFATMRGTLDYTFNTAKQWFPREADLDYDKEFYADDRGMLYSDGYQVGEWVVGAIPNYRRDQAEGALNDDRSDTYGNFLDKEDDYNRINAKDFSKVFMKEAFDIGTKVNIFNMNTCFETTGSQLFNKFMKDGEVSNNLEQNNQRNRRLKETISIDAFLAPNLKTIGIGVSYLRATNTSMMNGQTGLYIMTSEAEVVK